MEASLICTIIVVVAGALFFHFKEKKSLEKDIRDLEQKIHHLEKDIIALRHKDELQQMTLDSIPNLFQVVNNFMEVLKRLDK